MVRPLAPATRRNRSKMCGNSGSGMPVPVSWTVSSACFPRALRESVTQPAKGELQSVREKVQNDFLPHLAVNVDRLGKRLAIDLES